MSLVVIGASHRSAPLSFWLLPVLALFPTVATLVSIQTLLVGARNARLLRVGLSLPAEVVESKDTPSRINGKPVKRLTLEYKIAEETHRSTLQTTQEMQTDTVLVDPKRPTQALAWSQLPGIHVDAQGNLGTNRPGRAALLLILPTAAVLTIALAALILA